VIGSQTGRNVFRAAHRSAMDGFAHFSANVFRKVYLSRFPVKNIFKDILRMGANAVLKRVLRKFGPAVVKIQRARATSKVGTPPGDRMRGPQDRSVRASPVSSAPTERPRSGGCRRQPRSGSESDPPPQAFVQKNLDTRGTYPYFSENVCMILPSQSHQSKRTDGWPWHSAVSRAHQPSAEVKVWGGPTVSSPCMRFPQDPPPQPGPAAQGEFKCHITICFV
jgi:hypothetical protein